MIICSCNVLSDGDIRGCLASGSGCPKTPAQVYNQLGCKAECGQCARTIRAIMNGEKTGLCPAACCPLQDTCALADGNDASDTVSLVGSLGAVDAAGLAIAE